MDIIEMFWLLWLDGWMFDHWVSVVWMVSTTATCIGYPILYTVHVREMLGYGVYPWYWLGNRRNF